MRLEKSMNKKSLNKVICPSCGYKMPIFLGLSAKSKDVWVFCKGRNCGKWIEIKTETK